MRSTDRPDEDAPQLGKAIPPKPPEKPKDEEVRPGVFKDKSGRLYTDIPTNNAVKAEVEIDWTNWGLCYWPFYPGANQ